MQMCCSSSCKPDVMKGDNQCKRVSTAATCSVFTARCRAERAMPHTQGSQGSQRSRLYELLFWWRWVVHRDLDVTDSELDEERRTHLRATISEHTESGICMYDIHQRTQVSTRPVQDGNTSFPASLRDLVSPQHNKPIWQRKGFSSWSICVVTTVLSAGEVAVIEL